MINKFPKSFLWGSATSGYQIEGDSFFSDWYEMLDKKQTNKLCDKAVNFWQDYKTYIALMKEAKFNSFRMSIEWSRINPQENNYSQKAINRYKEIIYSLKENGIEPIVTLWHFALPHWFSQKGGFLNKNANNYFLTYVEKVKAEFNDLINYYLVFNEPTVYLLKGYLSGSWPPFHKNQLLPFLKIRKKLAKIYLDSYDILKDKNTQISIAANLSFNEMKNKFNPLNYLTYLILEQNSDLNILNKIRNKLDFIGLNYYFRQLIDINIFNLKESLTRQEKNKKYSDLGWEIYPEGIYKLTTKLYKKFQKPILITENGIADKNDSLRSEFLKEHIEYLFKAYQEGIPILGYLHWSLMDNCEWDKGKEPRFGLIEADYQNKIIKPRESFYFYKKLIESYTSKI